MPDWHELVQQRLGRLGLDSEREGEIIAEIADHLEDVYDDLRRRGLGAKEALVQAMRDASDWAELRQQIRRAELEEDAMNHRTKCVWVPGLGGLTLSMGLWWLLYQAGMQVGWLYPRLMWVKQVALSLSPLWLIAQVAIGAVAAYASQRAGGDSKERLLASLFPAWAMMILFAAILPVGLVVDSHVPKSLVFLGFACTVISFVLMPGMGLFLGALPFLKSPPRLSGRPQAQG